MAANVTATRRAAASRVTQGGRDATGIGAPLDLGQIVASSETSAFVSRAERASVSTGLDDRARVHAFVREMHVWLLAGYAADAVLRATAVVEIALMVLSGAKSDAGAALGELLVQLPRRGTAEQHAEASWLYQLRIASGRFSGQICGDYDHDAHRAAAIAIRFAQAAGLITEVQVAECQSAGAWSASEPPSSALLRLDRAMHRKVLDDLLTISRRVLVVLVHGEVDQGHDHIAEIMTWRLRSASGRGWREVVVKWPPPSRSLGTRLAMLLDELARALGLKVVSPNDDPTTPDGVRAWAPTVAKIITAVDANRDRLLVRHVLRWLRTGPGGDDALVDAYIRTMWANVAGRPGERVVVGLALRRIERGGLPMTKAWWIARAELAAARAIESGLERYYTTQGGLCVALPELTSVPVRDLVDWLRAEGSRNRDTAEVEARQLVASTRGGRFDLVVQRLTALNVERR